jgi:predicted adenylyl cyclase CyaB
MHLNIEIKARCHAPQRVRAYLLSQGAAFKGTDAQEDTYFVVPNGRLKLRQGNIENALIHYDRADAAGPKSSHVNLYATTQGDTLKALLTKALGIRMVVKKEREIYFIGNVKFHIDVVPELGNFVEIEAIDTDGSIGAAKLQEQCAFYMQALAIEAEDLLSQSYSDMMQ